MADEHTRSFRRLHGKQSIEGLPVLTMVDDYTFQPVGYIDVYGY